jgi:putative MATE family efflux protein
MTFKDFWKGGSRSLTEGSIWKTLFALSAPLVLGTTLRLALNITDTFWVGMLGSDALAAISVTFPVFFIFIAVASGLSVGSTALISQAIGAKHGKRANNVAEHSIIIAGMTGIVIAILGFIFSPYIFAFMGVSGKVLEMTLSYTNLIFFGFIFVFLDFIAQSIINADGNTIVPTKNLAFTVVLNAILDPLFIFGYGPVPAMGLFGAALATVIAFTVSISLNISYVLRNRTSVKIDLRCFRWDLSIVRNIAAMGFPSSLSQSINSVGMILLMGLVGGFGVSAIAAFGVGMRLEALAILPVIGLISGLIPFVGQNLGAKKPERAKRAVTIASYGAVLFMSLFSLVWFFLPAFLYYPFTSDPEVIGIGIRYFQIIAFGYVFLGLNFVLGSAFQGAGRTGLQLLVNFVRWSGILITSYALLSVMGITGIWIGFPVGNLMGFLAAFAILKSGIWLKGWHQGERPKPAQWI